MVRGDLRRFVVGDDGAVEQQPADRDLAHHLEEAVRRRAARARACPLWNHMSSVIARAGERLLRRAELLHRGAERRRALAFAATNFATSPRNAWRFAPPAWPSLRPTRSIAWMWFVPS